MAKGKSNKHSTVAGPLKSWDIFLNNYQQLMQKGDDLKAIKKLSEMGKWSSDWDLQDELINRNTVIVITDEKRKIVFATANILEMTGYSPKELLDKKPDILQGEATDQNVLKEIRAKIAAKEPFEATIVNYRKNGEPYDCMIKAFPVFNDNNELVNFIAFEKAA